MLKIPAKLSAAIAVFALLGSFWGISAAAETEGSKLLVVSPPLPLGKSEVRLPYPPGPDFSWLWKGGSGWQRWGGGESKTAVENGDSLKLTAQALPAVGRIPLYLRMVLLVVAIFVLVVSYFFYRKEKSERLLNDSLYFSGRRGRQ
ncbi:MAG: hypothetical protein ONA90_08055 [candidate division KSB1 bacterium]|nr:hypothetical protein [candidate division KSB1 bacterium]